jgi:hypothetical protein
MSTKATAPRIYEYGEPDERRDLVKAGSVLRHVPRECGLHQDTKN